MITLKLVAPTGSTVSEDETSLGKSLVGELNKLYEVGECSFGMFHSVIKLKHPRNVSLVLFFVANLSDRYRVQDQLQKGELGKYTQGELSYAIVQSDHPVENKAAGIKQFIDYILNPKTVSKVEIKSLWEEF